MTHHRLAVAVSLFAVALPAQNTGVLFDASLDGYIEVPYSAQVVPQSGITVEAWITYDESTLGTGWRWPTIVRHGINSGGENYMLRVGAANTNSRNLVWKVVTQTGASVLATYPFQPGEFLAWTHVAGTYDGNTLALYINGVQVATAPGSGQPIRDVNDVLRIGKGSDVATPIEVWNGGLDEVRIWPFARSAEDIQQSMNLELTAVPGYVSTWNLNNDFLDSSGGQHATSSGQATFTANPLALSAPIFAFGIQAGASSPGCLGDLKLCPSGPSVAGYNDFRVVCTRVPPAALTVWGGSVGTVTTPLPLLGVDVWLDPTGLVVVSNTADALGSSSASLPIPPGISGFSFGIQCIALDPCGQQGFTASDALVIVI